MNGVEQLAQVELNTSSTFIDQETFAEKSPELKMKIATKVSKIICLESC